MFNKVPSSKLLRTLVWIIILVVAFLVLRHVYRHSAYNYIGTKEERFEAQVTDEKSGRTYNVPATVQYNPCANDLRSIGLDCYAGVSVNRITWPDGGYTTFPSSCSFRNFDTAINCQASNGKRSYTVKVLNKKLD